MAFEIVRPRHLLISEYSASDAVRTNRMIRRSVRTSIDLGRPEQGEDWPFVGVERYFWMVSLTVDLGTLRTLEICRCVRPSSALPTIFPLSNGLSSFLRTIL